MASWLVRLTPDRVVWVQVLARDVVLCSWERHFTLTVPLSTQVYKWVLAKLMLGVTLRWIGIPSRGNRNTPTYSLHATETGDKCRPGGSSRLVADFSEYVLIVPNNLIQNMA